MELMDVFPDQGGAEVLSCVRFCRYRHSGRWFAIVDFLDGTPEVQTATFETMEGLRVGVVLDRKVRNR